MDVNLNTNLWVPFNPSSLLANACLVRFGVYHFQQIQGVVDTPGGEALDLLRFLAGLFHAAGTKTASSGKGARTCGLGVLLFIASLIGSGFLGCCVGFLLREETSGFRLAGELLLALGLLIDTLILLSTLTPLGCLETFL